jgi:hypothetical protein
VAIIVTPVVTGGGASSGDPYVIPLNGGGSFVFTPANMGSDPQNGRWYDPPYADGFEYTVIGTTFQSVTLPGYSGAQLIIGGVNDGVIPANGSSGLVNGVTDFELIGISPVVDEASPGFLNAYPVQLFFNGAFTSLTITPLAAPEPGMLSLLCVGFGALGLIRARRRPARPDTA